MSSNSQFLSIGSERLPPVYRYMSPEYASAFELGDIYISTAATFRRQEDAQGDPLDSDVEFERFSTTQLDGASWPSHPLSKMPHITLAPHVNNVTLKSMKFSFVPLDAHIMCLTTDPKNDLFIRAGKTAVFEIFSPVSFMLKLAHASKKLGRRMNIGPVAYGPRQFDPMVTPEPRPDFYIKRINFADEREVRMVWLTSGPCEPITIQAPRASKHFRRLS